MRYKISLDVETEKEKGLIEAYIRWSLKMLKINGIKIGSGDEVN